jgi:general secretion pathway protein M
MNLKVDRRLIVSSGIVFLFVLSLVSFEVSLSVKKERSSLRSQEEELLALASQYEGLKRAVDSVEGKKSLTKVAGIVQAVDEVFGSLGLNEKVKSVKSAGTKEKKYATEEEADVSVEKVSMNEMMNILYKIENAPMILSVKRTSIKSSFDDPSLLNITMTIGLITPK